MLKIEKKKLAWYLITTGIFAVLIYLADIGKFVDALADVKINYLIVATAFGSLTFLFWAFTWQVLFDSVGIGSKMGKTIRLTFSGNFMNSVTPLGQFGGEPFMAYIVSDNTDASYEKSLSCIVSADIINASPIITYMGGGLLYLIFFGGLEGFFVKFVYLTLALLFTGVLLGYLLWFKEDSLKNAVFYFLDRLKSRINFLEKYSDPLRSRIERAERSFNKVGQDPKVILKGLILSHLAIGSQFVALYLVLASKGLEPSITAIFFTVIISGFSIWAPTPGGAGAYEATFSAILMMFYSISLDIALALAILFRIATFWSGILIGYPAILSLGMGLREEKKE